jgi:hypothetical protein
MSCKSEVVRAAKELRAEARNRMVQKTCQTKRDCHQNMQSVIFNANDAIKLCSIRSLVRASFAMGVEKGRA